MPKTKPFKTLDEQIEILIKRGVIIKDRKDAKSKLMKYNYFDLINGFETTLLKTKNPKSFDKIHFNDFYSLYNFDARLTNEFLIAIFEFESKLRSSISYHFTKRYCNSSKDTMNYTNSTYYKNPFPNHKYKKYWAKKFYQFPYFSNNGSNFISDLKRRKDYVAVYDKPPLWIVIKTMPLGSLFFNFIFLDDDVKEDVLNDFGLTLNDSDFMIQSIHVIKELRNTCAHLELVTRFRASKNEKLDTHNDILNKLHLQKRKDLSLLHTTILLGKFVDIRRIKRLIISFYFKMYISGRLKVVKAVYSKMGSDKISNWLKL